MRIKHVAFVMILVLCASCSNRYVPSGAYKLVWSEEFNTDSLSSRKWRITQQGANFNHEDQAYLKDQVALRDGMLVLKCEKQHWDGPSGRSDIRGSVSREYISGEINTRESWRFARIEVRAKVPPRNKGILSAFWMTPADRSWPPEIDIAEVLGSHVDTAVFTNHWGLPENRAFNASSYRSDDLSGAFHIYAVEWDKDEIRWFLDGVQRARSTKGVPDIPMIVRISLPVGPDWEGNPDGTSVFPQELVVDWVRVYTRS